MKYIIGKDRNQVEFLSLEDQVEQENEVRLIDLFVNSLNLSEFGFKESMQNIQGGRFKEEDQHITHQTF